MNIHNKRHPTESAAAGKTAYYTARASHKHWYVYRIIEESPDYPGVKWLEERVSKALSRDEAVRIVGELMCGLRYAHLGKLITVADRKRGSGGEIE